MASLLTELAPAKQVDHFCCDVARQDHGELAAPCTLQLQRGDAKQPSSAAHQPAAGRDAPAETPAYHGSAPRAQRGQTGAADAADDRPAGGHGFGLQSLLAGRGPSQQLAAAPAAKDAAMHPAWLDSFGGGNDSGSMQCGVTAYADGQALFHIHRPQAPPAAGGRSMPASASSPEQQLSKRQNGGGAGAASGGSARGGGGGRAPLADNSNCGAAAQDAAAEEMAWEQQAESPDPEEVVHDGALEAAGGPTGADEAAASMVQQCESIFSFL